MPILTTIEGLDASGKTTVQNFLKEVLDDPVLTTEPNDSEGYDPKWNTTDWFGDQVREAISTSDEDPLSVLFFFLADHSHHYATTIKPALDAGNDVICDRYIGSRYAYQSLSLSERVQGDAVSYLRSLHEKEFLIDEEDAVVQMVLQSADKHIPERLQSEVPLIGRYFFGMAKHPELYPEMLSSPTDDFPGLTEIDEPLSWSKLPDYTILLDIPVDVAIERMGGVEGDEVFEKRDFLEQVREQYLHIADRLDTRFTTVDATQSKEAVCKEVRTVVSNR